MKLLVGLGNPGSKHERNRHNIGFLAVDRIAETTGIASWRNRHQGLVAAGRLGESKVTLLKPQTFMNGSGQSVGEAMRYLRLTPADVIVFHDELDLAPGKIRSKSGGGHAGHNGLRSLHQHIGPEFVRVRLGIGHPGDKQLVTPYVLGNFMKSDREWLSELLDLVGECAPELVSGGTGSFQNCIGRRRQAAAPDRQPEGKGRVGHAQAARVEPEQRSGAFHILMKLFKGQGPGRN